MAAEDPLRYSVVSLLRLTFAGGVPYSERPIGCEHPEINRAVSRSHPWEYVERLKRLFALKAFADRGVPRGEGAASLPVAWRHFSRVVTAPSSLARHQELMRSSTTARSGTNRSGSPPLRLSCPASGSGRPAHPVNTTSRLPLSTRVSSGYIGALCSREHQPLRARRALAGLCCVTESPTSTQTITHLIVRKSPESALGRASQWIRTRTEPKKNALSRPRLHHSKTLVCR